MLRHWMRRAVTKDVAALKINNRFRSRPFSSKREQLSFTISKHAQNKSAKRAANVAKRKQNRSLSRLAQTVNTEGASDSSDRSDAALLLAKVEPTVTPKRDNGSVEQNAVGDEKAGAVNKIRKIRFSRPFRYYMMTPYRNYDDAEASVRKESAIDANAMNESKVALGNLYTFDEHARGRLYSSSLQRARQRKRRNSLAAKKNSKEKPLDGDGSTQPDLGGNFKREPRVKIHALSRVSRKGRLLQRKRGPVSKLDRVWMRSHSKSHASGRSRQIVYYTVRTVPKNKQAQTADASGIEPPDTHRPEAIERDATTGSEPKPSEERLPDDDLMDAIDDLTLSAKPRLIWGRRRRLLLQKRRQLANLYLHYGFHGTPESTKESP